MDFQYKTKNKFKLFANRRSTCFNIEMLIRHDLKCHLDQDPEVFLKFCCLLNSCWKVIGLFFFIILTGVGWHYPIICKRRNVQEILESDCSGKCESIKISKNHCCQKNISQAIVSAEAFNECSSNNKSCYGNSEKNCMNFFGSLYQ